MQLRRFLNYELGRNDHEQLKKVFSTSMMVHVSIAVIALLLLESIGLWFVNTQLNVPFERMDAINWVYQFTIITFTISILQVPYNASIIAHEQMSFYAYLSIFEVILKLIVVYTLQYLGSDKLKLYAILMCALSFIVFVIHKKYCTNKFLSCHFYFIWDVSLFKQLLNFSGWSLFGSVANIGKTQVINVLLNIFRGVSVNAAMGVANQVSTALNNFVSNFQLAFNPQIVKAYAANERDYLMQLIFRTSKFSYFLLFFLSLPILINMDLILILWLKMVPDYTTMFCRLTILYLLVETISGPLWMTVQATGQIKKYQIVISSVLLLNVPFSYLLLKIGYAPYYVLWVNVGIGIFAFITRIAFLKSLINLPVMRFCKNVLLNILIVTAFSLPIPLLLSDYTHGLLRLVTTSVVAFISVGITVYYIGLNKHERRYVNDKVLTIIKKVILGIANIYE